jgi:hypothetical protein
MSAATAWRKEMAAGLENMQAQSGGVVSIFVVRQCDVISLLGGALGGDVASLKVLRAVNVANDRIEQAPRRKPMLCASCPRPLRHSGYAVVVALPDNDEASQALTLAVCKHCATEPAAIGSKALDGFRRFWPDLRAFTVSAEAGHA